jgi:hypothetical protein
MCAQLAQQIGLPILAFNIVETMASEQWFGSSWATGEIKDWWVQVLSGKINISDIQLDLSRIYAFDLFVNNVDRHVRNYMVRAEGASHRVFAMDHGRAWLFGGFPPPAPPMAACPTISCRDWMKSNFGDFQSVPAMIALLDNIRHITPANIADILARQPAHWLDTTRTNEVQEWWDSGEATARLDVISDGITYGTLI